MSNVAKELEMLLKGCLESGQIKRKTYDEILAVFVSGVQAVQQENQKQINEMLAESEAPK
jgi:uncharacterized protein YhaN